MTELNKIEEKYDEERKAKISEYTKKLEEAFLKHESWATECVKQSEDKEDYNFKEVEKLRI